jgi:tRNA modification GTPase
MPFDPETIVAISTPPGRGGIGIVRLSGPQARSIAEPILRLRHPLAAGHARFAELVDDTGAVLDEAVVTFFAAPHSYTAEDVVEIACHGSPVLLDFVVRACMARGARLAEPGEFTQRAFLSGRLDLTQAEAVNDLIASHTLHQARTAAAQLGGSVARAIAPAKQSLLHLIAELEAGIDFAEDDLDLMPQNAIVTTIVTLQAALETLASTYRYGRIVREGFTLAIVGRPNAGKSSLFNRLLERERAIVTAQPGTTRDPISERVSLGGVPVEMIDTAGLRDAPSGPEGEAETQGILRSRTTMADADFVVLVVDATAAPHEEDARTLASLAGRPHQVVLNKSDLPHSPAMCHHFGSPAILTSARTGDGLDTLRQAILATLTQTAPASDGALIANLRQHAALAQALTALTQAHTAALATLPHEMLLLDLHAALDALDRLTGQTTADDILSLIFSTFCIGK